MKAFQSFIYGAFMNSLLLNPAAAAELIGVCERKIHILSKEEGFPEAVGGLGPKMKRFRRADLEAWVAALPAKVAGGEPSRLAGGKVAAGRVKSTTYATRYEADAKTVRENKAKREAEAAANTAAGQ